MMGHLKFCCIVTGGIIFMGDPLNVMRLTGIILTTGGIINSTPTLIFLKFKILRNEKFKTKYNNEYGHNRTFP